MNIYVVVEGDVTEKIVYSKWITYANPILSEISHPSLVTQNNFVIVSGQGYPQYRVRIERAAADVQNIQAFDRLVVAVDSEDGAQNDKYLEIEQIILGTRFSKDYRIIVQHFCFEAWALGNKRVARRNSRDADLIRYRAIHDVVSEDPERLPDFAQEELNRARFSLKYLKALLRDRAPNLHYSKSDPGIVKDRVFFDALCQRRIASGHIGSFQAFLTAFV